MCKNKKVLIVVAHPDDEVYGMGGTIAKLCENHNEVYVVYITGGETSSGGSRIHLTDNVSKILGFKQLVSLKFTDQKLDSVSNLFINSTIKHLFDKINPDIVYTHAIEDLNIDHRTVHNSVMVVCRPQTGCSVKELYTFCVSNWDFGEFGNFIPNTFIDIEKYNDEKLKAMKVYSSEVKKYPHPMSIKNIHNRDINSAAKFCLNSVEEFKQIFRIM